MTSPASFPDSARNRALAACLTRRQFLKHTGLGAIAGLALMTLGACNNDPNRFSIVITPQSTFSPSPLVIPAGSTVIWLNNNTEAFTVTCDPNQVADKAHVRLPPNAPSWDSGDLYPGEQWSYTFNTKGFFLYTSRLSNPESSTGIVVVTA